MACPEFTPEEIAREEWRDIDGYDGRYQVSDLGRVRSVITNVLKFSPNNRGYDRVTLYRFKGQRPGVWAAVHALVARAFLGRKPSDDLVINHMDGRKPNNRAMNLEYCTSPENTRHAAALGLMPKGIKNGASKLSELNVHEIRRCLEEGQSIKDVAHQFDISRTLASQIKKRERWEHI